MTGSTASICLIGAESGWGAGIRSTQDGPAALRELGLGEWLIERGLAATWHAAVRSARHHAEGANLAQQQIFDLVATHCSELAAAVAGAMAGGGLPVVIGGDHAVAMGSWGGVARALKNQPFGLVWLDAHLDAHTMETTPSMNAHGMCAAALLGHGDPRFLEVCGGAVRPEHLCYVGVRSYEAEEMALLRRLGVRIIEMGEVKRRGIEAALDEAFAIATRGTAGYGVTIDLDGFDPRDVPAIGLKLPDGLRVRPTLSALAGHAHRPGLKAIEIVEYVPSLDRGLRTAELVRDLILALLSPSSGRLQASQSAQPRGSTGCAARQGAESPPERGRPAC
jgi:arginase